MSYFFSQFSSVAQSCPTLCDPMDCSTPGLPVCCQFPECTQTHVHWVGDVIQPLILCLPLFLPPSVFPSIRVFSNESVLCVRWPKNWSFSFSISPSNVYSGLISFRMDWLDLLAVLLLNSLQILNRTSQTQSVTKTHVSSGLTLKHQGRTLHNYFSGSLGSNSSLSATEYM